MSLIVVYFVNYEKKAKLEFICSIWCRLIFWWNVVNSNNNNNNCSNGIRYRVGSLIFFVYISLEVCYSFILMVSFLEDWSIYAILWCEMLTMMMVVKGNGSCNKDVSLFWNKIYVGGNVLNFTQDNFCNIIISLSRFDV